MGAGTSRAGDVMSLALGLLERGWHPLPLPIDKKTPPPAGTTGYNGRDLRRDDLPRHGWAGNLGVRMPRNVIGLDVDAYKGGLGTLSELVARFGPLPPTVLSTARHDGSGIKFYRVPANTFLQTAVGTNIELVQRFHRYAVVAPSIHPTVGTPYRTVDEQSGELLDMLPDTSDIPELPWPWLDGLSTTRTKSNGTHAAAVDFPELERFLSEHTSNTRPAALLGVTSKLERRTKGRHDTLVDVACWAFREAAAGWYSSDMAAGTLWRWWTEVMDDERRRDGAEFVHALCYAVAQAEADPERIAELRNDTSNVPGDIGTDTPLVVLPADLWEAAPVLSKIRDAAFSRLRSPDAVLGGVMARRALLIPPQYQIPPIAGAPGSLNIVIGYVSSAGGGKSSTYAIARSLVPVHLRNAKTDRPVGSGEGIAEAFYDVVDAEGANGKAVKERRCGPTSGGTHTVGMFVDEGESIAALAARNGSTTGSALRKAWSGSGLGESNASQETHRNVPAHSYRFSMLACFQYTNAATILADSDTGTAQRFLWVGTKHPGIVPVDGSADTLAPLDLAPLPQIGERTEPVWVWYPELVRQEIRRAEAEEMSGRVTANPLDTHRRMMRLKVAAILATIIAPDVHPPIVDELTWELAGTILDTSDAHRATIESFQRDTDAESGRLAAAKAGSRRQAELEAEDKYQRGKVAAVLEFIVSKLEDEPDGITLAVLRRRVTASGRPYFDDAITHGIDTGQLRRWTEPGQGDEKQMCGVPK